ncbi:MAG: ATP-binding protein [Leptothrix ochracea]|uniref:sensor histidine kinase n=1 Tax=Leptothrix ochracea TaxID=735331 RepID=UPI0034E22137
MPLRILGFLLLLIWLAGPSSAGPMVDQPVFTPIDIAQARVLVTAHPEPDQDTASTLQAQPIPLPYVQELPFDAIPRWYRIDFQLDPLPPETLLLGARIQPTCRAPEIRLNGHRLLDHPPVGADNTDCQHSELLSLPAPLLRQGINHLDVRIIGTALPSVAARERAATLGPVRIDTYNMLRTLDLRHRLLHDTVPKSLAAAVGVIGLITLLLTPLSRLPYLGTFGLAAMGWCLLEFLARGVGSAWLPFDPGLNLNNDLLLALSITPVAVAGSLFLLRYCGARSRRLERLLWLQSLVPALGMLIGPRTQLHAVTEAWTWLLVLEVSAALSLFLMRAWRLSRVDFWVLASGLLTLAGLASVDVLLRPGAMSAWPAHTAVSAAFLATFLGMSLRMIQRLKNTIKAAENLRKQLELRVQEISADMERNYGQMAELRVEQVTARERKRIAADLHDDLGAKLLTIVHTSESDRISTLAREALEEMRLSVRGLTGKPIQMADAVGDWRSEAKSRLSHGNIELIWLSPDDLLMDDRKMSARAYVQTTRILREAISNLLKHSQASQCRISIQVESNDFELTIADNGRGIPVELDGRLDRGHGMSTMKGRAKQLQGQCLVESAPGYGTTIRLTLPL